MRRKKEKRNIITRISAVFAALILAFPFSCLDVNANATGTLNIKVGYYGWSPSDYVDKATFSDSDIRAMSDGSLKGYTYYDANGKRVAIDSAHGATLRGILDSAGIDQGSIAALDFYTSDSGSGAFASFTMQTLLLTRRYFFNDLAGHLAPDGSFANEDAEQELWNTAKSVDVVLAYEDNWQWYPAGTPGSGTSGSGMNTANRFRLCFGQSNPLDFRTYQSAKQVETIYVMFQGVPKLTVDETNISAKIGSSHKVKVTAAAADDALNDKVQSQVKYSSSDTSVVTVDEDGTLHYVGKGKATVTVSSGGASTTIEVEVGKKGSDGEGDGGGGGNGNGGNGKSNSKTAPKKSDVKTDDTPEMYVLSEDAGRNLQLALMKQAEASDASMGTYQKEMDNDAEQLQVKKETNVIAGTALLGGGIFVLGGSLFGCLRYKKQRWG